MTTKRRDKKTKQNKTKKISDNEGGDWRETVQPQGSIPSQQRHGTPLKLLMRGDGGGDAKSLAQEATNTADGLGSQITPTSK